MAAPIGVSELLAKEELKGGFGDRHGRTRKLLMLAQEILPELILCNRGRIAMNMIGQTTNLTDVLLACGWLEVFEFDKPLEPCDGRIISIHVDRGCPQST